MRNQHHIMQSNHLEKFLKKTASGEYAAGIVITYRTFWRNRFMNWKALGSDGGLPAAKTRRLLLAAHRGAI